MQKRCRVDAQVGLKPVQAPVEVLVNLCLKEDTLDETLSYLLKKAKQRRSLLHLRCQKLRIFTMPMQSIRRILKVVQLDSIQDLEVNCTWKLAMLGRCLKTPVETLWITKCLISESDLTYLSQCPSVSLLKDLGLSGDLDLDECGIMDSQFSALLPSLSHCSQLTTYSFCGNTISMAMLEILLLYTVGLIKLSYMLYPALLESYEDVNGILYLGLLAQPHA
ncbi:hypothetical protein E5288_WYG013388 [Bos mutus]|uniref:Uncharacterized protein n=1 Tax=Bos mutus TaxID=72004 RepID=A0A6B0SGP8_9CETA|nr:hypothetical protein [Bos mutus]